MATFRDMLEGDPRIVFEDHLGAAGRLVVVVVQPGDAAEVARTVYRAAEEMNLVLFDTMQGKLVTYSRRRSSSQKPALLSKLRRAVETTPVTGDLRDDRVELDRSVRATLLPRDIDPALRPQPVSLPFAVPDGFEAVVPRIYPLERRSTATRRQRLTQLDSSRPEKRRAAALHIGGWLPDEAIQQALETRVARDPDPYVRAVSAVALAARGRVDPAVVRAVAHELIDQALKAPDPVGDEAASIGALAAVIGAAEKYVSLQDVRSIVAKLGRVSSQGPRAQALAGVVESIADAT